MSGEGNLSFPPRLRWNPYSLVEFLLFFTFCQAWLPDGSQKLSNDIGQIKTSKFVGNLSYPDHFVILDLHENSVAIGGRNAVYNLTLYDFLEVKESRIEWPSSEAHAQLCSLKGKTEDDCQNYIRIFVNLGPDLYLVCGTNSYKPLCRQYSVENGKYEIVKEMDGVGICPYNPEHNSTAVFYEDQLYSATVADFSGGDPLIYRKPQRTELSDLKQLNAPNFVNSVPYGDYIFFFYRETAVEFINCGKVIYSRVARVCKDDKGGPHQFGERWTSFLKTRLNCSVPGEYPFYFDEIQSTSDIVRGRYGSNDTLDIIYGTLTTPVNAIGGSAICAYNMNDILRVFEGTFKHQETINSNWLPVPKDKVPEPRPGRCVNDSRLLPENSVNFVKSHSLMENTLPNLFQKPILIRVSLQYRFTAIAVDAQVPSINGNAYDVIYVGTDNGKVLKVVNIANLAAKTSKAVVISENTILPNGASVKQLKVVPGYGKVLVVGRDEVRLAELNHCSAANDCMKCISLQDPHCAWNIRENTCISLEATSTPSHVLLQDIVRGDGRICLPTSSGNKLSPPKPFEDDRENEIIPTLNEASIADFEEAIVKGAKKDVDCNATDGNNVSGCAVQQRLVIYTAETLHLVVIGACLAGLLFGFVAGYLFSRRFHMQPQYPDVPFIEQHNQLDRLSGNQSGYLTPRANKAVNLVVNVPSTTPSPKKDNLDASKDLNIASDGTLQKIKKTYI